MPVLSWQNGREDVLGSAVVVDHRVLRETDVDPCVVATLAGGLLAR